MLQTKNDRLGYTLVVLAGFLWGPIGALIKEMSLLGADALYISFIRVLFSFLVMLVLTIFVLGRSSLHINRRQLVFSALLGIICHGIYNIFYSYAIPLAGVAVSAVLLNIAPVVTLGASMILLSEKCTSWKIIAIVLNCIGCTLTATGGDFTLATVSVVGILCGIGAGLCYAMTAIIGYYSMSTTHVFVSSTYSYFFAALVLFLPARPWLYMGNPENGNILLLGAILALGPTALAYVLYYRGLSMIRETSKVPVAASGESVVASFIGLYCYNENLTPWSWTGIVLVLLSIICMNIKKSSTDR